MNKINVAIVDDNERMVALLENILNQDEEIAELARILGGAEITETVMRSAAEMKQLAKSAK